MSIVAKRICYNKLKICFDNINEIALLATLRHPNLSQFWECRLVAIVECYILLEKIEGIPLKALDGESLLSHNTKAKIINQLANVINFLHTNIVHLGFRSLKPDAIMIDRKNIKITLLNFRNESIYSNSTYIEGWINNESFKLENFCANMPPEIFNRKNKKEHGLSSESIYGMGLVFILSYSQQIPFKGYKMESLKVYMENDDMLFSTSKIKSRSKTYNKVAY